LEGRLHHNPRKQAHLHDDIGAGDQGRRPVDRRRGNPVPGPRPPAPVVTISAASAGVRRSATMAPFSRDDARQSGC
jgi:hypothetical protein